MQNVEVIQAARGRKSSTQTSQMETDKNAVANLKEETSHFSPVYFSPLAISTYLNGCAKLSLVEPDLMLHLLAKLSSSSVGHGGK